MAEFKLQAEPPLAGTDIQMGETRLTAPKDLAVVAIALPLGGEDKALKAIKVAYGIALPGPGLSAEAADGSTRLMRTAPDQALAIFTRADPDAEKVVAEALGDTVYLTDQTDTLCALELSGPGARAALERICPLDLHPQAFAIGAAARTVMEHLGVFIARTGEDSFLLLSASSSAGSFLHAVETSLKNTN
ncbi:MAG: sarcosine oxidase subunit gamma family protein [Roseovarius sp.]